MVTRFNRLARFRPDTETGIFENEDRIPAVSVADATTQGNVLCHFIFAILGRVE